MRAPSSSSNRFLAIWLLIGSLTGGGVSLRADETVAARTDDNSLNSGWLFRMDAGDAAPFPETPDVNWQSVDLPHIRSVNRIETASSFAGIRRFNSTRASAWYRRHVTLPEVPKGKMIFLTLCGDATGMRIWVNGHKFDPIPPERNCAEYDITQRFRVGPDFDNVIAIEHRETSSGPIAFPGQTPAAGISLNVRNRVHLVTEQFELIDPVIGQNRAHVRLRTAVANHRESPAEVTVQNRLFSPRGELVGKSAQRVAVSPGERSSIANDIYFPAHDIQAPGSGRAYRVTTTLLEGSKQLDQIESIRDGSGFTEIRHSHFDPGEIVTAK